MVAAQASAKRSCQRHPKRRYARAPPVGGGGYGCLLSEEVFVSSLLSEVKKSSFPPGDTNRPPLVWSHAKVLELLAKVRITPPRTPLEEEKPHVSKGSLKGPMQTSYRLSSFWGKMRYSLWFSWSSYVPVRVIHWLISMWKTTVTLLPS